MGSHSLSVVVSEGSFVIQVMDNALVSCSLYIFFKPLTVVTPNISFTELGLRWMHTNTAVGISPLGM